MRLIKTLLCLSAIITMSLQATPSLGEKRVTMAKQKSAQCALKETNTLNVSYTRMAQDIPQAKKLIDDRTQEIKDLAAKSGITNVDITSMNYSISSNNAGQGTIPSTFQVYGNITLQTEPADKALEYMAALTNIGYSVSYNANAYKRCDDTPVGAEYAD